LHSVYTVLDRAPQLKWAGTPLPHSLAYDSRLLIYNWFSRWLKNETATVREEPRTKPEEFSVLFATESGSVHRSLNSITPFGLNKARNVQRTPAPLDRLIGVTRPTAPAGRIISNVRSGTVNVQVLEVPSAPKVWIPAWILTPRDSPKNKPPLIVLDPTSAERLWFQPDADAV